MIVRVSVFVMLQTVEAAETDAEVALLIENHLFQIAILFHAAFQSAVAVVVVVVVVAVRAAAV